MIKPDEVVIPAGLPSQFAHLLAAAEKLYEFRNLILSRAGVAGYRQTGNGEWVCDPASQAFNDLGVEIKKAKKALKDVET